jgi:hypothetical protein
LVKNDKIRPLFSFSQVIIIPGKAKKGRICGNLSDIRCIIDIGGKNEIEKK